MDIKDLIVDPEFVDVLTSLYSMPYDVLKEEILEDGVVREPIVTWNNIIIDGHRRYDIIRKHPDRPIRYEIREVEFPNRNAALRWMYWNQLWHGPVIPYQRYYLIGKLYQVEQRDTCTKKDDLMLIQRIAKDYRIHEKTVKRAEKFAKGLDLAEETVPGARQDILAGKIRPSYKDILEFLATDRSKDRKKFLAEFPQDKGTVRYLYR